MKKLILFAAATMLFAANVNAAIWTITSTLQNDAETATGFASNLDGYGQASTSPTLGFLGWFTIGTNGGGNQMLNGRGLAPVNDYNCYGLPHTTQATDTCTNGSLTTFWNATNAEWTGTANDDAACQNTTMDLNFTPASGCLARSWTGIVGSDTVEVARAQEIEAAHHA